MATGELVATGTRRNTGTRGELKEREEKGRRRESRRREGGVANKSNREATTPMEPLMLATRKQGTTRRLEDDQGGECPYQESVLAI